MNVSEQLASAGRVFDEWAESTLYREAHRIGTQLLEKAVDIHLIGLYRELEFHALLSRHPTAKALTAALGFEDSAWIAIDAMLKRLSDRHCFLDSIDDDHDLRYQPNSVPDDQSQRLNDIRSEMAALGTDYLAPLEFLAFGAEHFVRALRDDHTFMDRVLTGQEKAFTDTWHRATNTDPLQDVHGIMGAKAVDLLFDSGCVLEVGGGTGNGIRNNLSALRDSGRLATLQKYVFTDVSMQFIVTTRNEFKGRYPDVDCAWRLLNINKDFAAQRIEEDSASLVYGVNAAHIAQDTVRFLGECRRVLRPAGLMVFSERIRRTTRDMAPREIVLNLSLYHRTAAIRHEAYRPAHAYLGREHWLRACELAGCSEFDVWPSRAATERYFPDQYAAVVVARV